jgi:hypothetical protein
LPFERALKNRLWHMNCKLIRPPAYFTPDWQAARSSVEALARLQPEVAAAGHGVPMRGEEMRRQLETLARDFDKVALPSHGRYKHDPAVTNDQGVVSVPPPVFDRQLPAVLAGAGAVVAIAAMLMRGGRR